jgi:prepilin-type N-terminal cleavage/methylation domain-containing protein
MTAMRIVSFARATRHRAFTIVELLVAVSILTLIVVVLYGLFDQVQRALRSNVAQVDVHEGGRAGMELMLREMEQMQAGNAVTNVNLLTRFTALPSRQALLNAGEDRTNSLEEVYFLSLLNKHWIGTGYRVLALNANGIPVDFAKTGVGTLCRFSLSNHVANFRSPSLYSRVMNVAPTNFANYQRVIDGVVHFRTRAYDHNGFLITNNFDTNILSGVFVVTNAFNDNIEYAFTNKALPATLEIELGVLDPHILERFRSYPTNATATVVSSNYLARQAGAIHLFQQRVPIRMAK